MNAFWFFSEELFILGFILFRLYDQFRISREKMVKCKHKY